MDTSSAEGAGDEQVRGGMVGPLVVGVGLVCLFLAVRPPEWTLRSLGHSGRYASPPTHPIWLADLDDDAGPCPPTGEPAPQGGAPLRIAGVTIVERRRAPSSAYHDRTTAGHAGRCRRHRAGPQFRPPMPH
jgi:hypothetical protein